MANAIKKVERFTKEQLVLCNALKSLIRLYYSVDRKKLRDKILSDLNRKKVEIFLKDIYGEILFCDKESHTYNVTLPYKMRSTNTTIKIIHDIDNKYLGRFVEIMDHLVDEARKCNYIHILLTGVEDHITTTITTRGEQKLQYNDSKDGHESEERFFGPYPDEMRSGIALVDKALFNTIHNRSTVGLAKNDVLVASALHERKYTVMPTTDFGCWLLSLESKDMIRTDLHYMSIWIDNIFQLLTAILIQFHLAFDGIKRLKVCNLCEKLYFEKKRGAKIYCSTSCRTKFTISSEKRERRLCRERQKMWARSYLRKSPDPVLKSECVHCNEFVESGKCPILLRKNEHDLEEERKLRLRKQNAHI